VDQAGRSAVYDALAGLSEREHAAIRLACLEKLSVNDIAHRLGVSKIQAVRTLADAMHVLRRAAAPSRQAPAGPLDRG